jgi:hypothetical protein
MRGSAPGWSGPYIVSRLEIVIATSLRRGPWLYATVGPRWAQPIGRADVTEP